MDNLLLEPEDLKKFNIFGAYDTIQENGSSEGGSHKNKTSNNSNDKKDQVEKPFKKLLKESKTEVDSLGNKNDVSNKYSLASPHLTSAERRERILHKLKLRKQGSGIEDLDVT